MAEFVLFLTGFGLGIAVAAPAILGAYLLGGGAIVMVREIRTDSREEETPEQRRERRAAEYRETAGRG